MCGGCGLETGGLEGTGGRGGCRLIWVQFSMLAPTVDQGNRCPILDQPPKLCHASSTLTPHLLGNPSAQEDGQTEINSIDEWILSSLIADSARS